MIDRRPPSPALLVEHLPAHLARQRWSGAARPPDRPRWSCVWHEVVAAGRADAACGRSPGRTSRTAASRTTSSSSGVRPATPLPDFLQGKERELIAVVPGRRDGDVVVYDALVDPDLAIAVLHLRRRPTSRSRCAGRSCWSTRTARSCSTRRTSSSCSARSSPGPNPDVEITRVLADARLRARARRRWPSCERDGTDLAVLREFLVGATEGWELARTSVRDLLAGALPPRSPAADFAPDAERLGAILAGLHLAMAEAWGREPGDAGALGRPRWTANLAQVLATVERCSPRRRSTPAAMRARFARPGGARPTPARRSASTATSTSPRCIKTDAGWRVLDFEGEPARRRDDRFTVLLAAARRRRACCGRSTTRPPPAWPSGTGDDDELGLAPLVARGSSATATRSSPATSAHDGIDAAPAAPRRRPRHRRSAAFELDKARLRGRLRARPPPRPGRDPRSAGITRLLRRPRCATIERPHLADDLWLFGEGRHERLWEVLGAHPATVDGVAGTDFAVWAPERHGRLRWSGTGTAGPPTTSRSSASTVRRVGRLRRRSGLGRALQVRGRWAPTAAACSARSRWPSIRRALGRMASIVFASEHRWADGDVDGGVGSQPIRSAIG